MALFKRLAAFLSDLRLAILLLLLIAIASAIGTILPQGEAADLYLNRFNADPWLGLINGDRMLQLQLDAPRRYSRLATVPHHHPTHTHHPPLARDYY